MQKLCKGMWKRLQTCENISIFDENRLKWSKTTKNHSITCSKILKQPKPFPRVQEMCAKHAQIANLLEQVCVTTRRMGKHAQLTNNHGRCAGAF